MGVCVYFRNQKTNKKLPNTSFTFYLLCIYLVLPTLQSQPSNPFY